MKYYSLIILGATVVIFLIQLVVGGFTESFLLQSNEVFSRPWTLITSIFLHGGFEHLLYNMFALAIFGIILENIIGSYKFVRIYFITGLFASMGALIYPASLGASGAIFGIMGTLAVLRPKLPVWVLGVPMPMFVAAGVWMLIDLAGLFSPTGTANAAHIIGFISGAAIGFFMKNKYNENKNIHIERKVSDKEMDAWENKWMK